MEIYHTHLLRFLPVKKEKIEYKDKLEALR